MLISRSRSTCRRKAVRIRCCVGCARLTNDAYRALIARARDTIPDVALSSDFIAGFCGENDHDHERTLRLIQDATSYDMAFLFAYSSRERTPAARRLEDDVPTDVKKRRLRVD